MEARLLRAIVAMAALLSMGANYRTPNFIITAPTQPMAEQIGQAAETFRRDLATLWLGKPMPNWSPFNPDVYGSEHPGQRCSPVTQPDVLQVPQTKSSKAKKACLPQDWPICSKRSVLSAPPLMR